MDVRLIPASSRIERPPFVWLGVALELLTGALAVPVGWLFITDPTGQALQMPHGWIEGTPFGSYLVPGFYLLAANGLGMLALAALTLARHRIAPWLTGTLGVGLIIWILVQIAVMPETMILTWVFLTIGFALGVVALFWLRATSQLRLW